MDRLHVVLLIAVFTHLEACASTLQAKPEQGSSFLENHARFGILADAVVPHVHARTKVNWSAYDKIQLKPIVIDHGFASRLSPDQEADLTLLTKSFYNMLAERLSKDYMLVQQPTSDAMILQVAIRYAEPS